MPRYNIEQTVIVHVEVEAEDEHEARYAVEEQDVVNAFNERHYGILDVDGDDVSLLDEEVTS